MKIIIKFIILILLVIISPSALANTYFRAELTGVPVITNTSITANVGLTYLQVGFARLFVSSLDQYITNNDNPLVKIPVNNLYLICDGQSFQISNTGIQMFYVDMIDFTRTAQKNVSLRLENIGELPAGTYSVPLKFINRTGITLDYECEFLLTFVVDEKQAVSSFSGDPYIILSEEDVFNKQISVKNKNDVRLDLTSNTNWKLWLDTSNIKELEGEYSLLVKNVSGNISNYEQNIVRLLPNQHYLLAQGTSTIRGTEPGNSIPTNLTLEYSFKNSETDKYIKEGIRQYPLTYVIERE